MTGYETLMQVCCGCNAAGSLTVILVFLLLPGVRSRSAKLLLWMLFCQLGLSLTVFINFCVKSPTTKFSITITFFVNFFTLSTLFWSVAMTMTMSFVIVQRNWLLERLSMQSSPITGFSSSGRQRMIRFHVFVWSFSLCLSLLPLFLNAYGDFSVDWFWFRSSREAGWIGVGCYYTPLLAGNLPCCSCESIKANDCCAVLVYNSVTLVWLRIIKSKFLLDGIDIFDAGSLAGQLYELAMSLKYYPLLAILSTVWSIVVGVCQTFSANSLPVCMIVGSILVQQLFGFFCAVFYFYNLVRSRQLICGACSKSLSRDYESDYVLFGFLAVARPLFYGKLLPPTSRSQRFSADSLASAKNPVVANSISDLNSLFAPDLDAPEQLYDARNSNVISVTGNIRTMDKLFSNASIDMALNSPDSSMSQSDDAMDIFDDSFKVAILGTPMVSTPYTPGGGEDHASMQPTTPRILQSLVSAQFETPRQQSARKGSRL
jgi:hypothetical protein